MNGKLTESMGTAYTGGGLSHKYEHLIQQATTTVFIKSPPTFALSSILNELAVYYVKRGYDVDRFRSPLHVEKTDGIYVKGPELFYIAASYPVPLEPTDLGGKHRVVSFYDVYDETKLRANNPQIAGHLEEAATYLEKALAALTEAKAIHDEWENVNIRRMDWQAHEAKIQSLASELFGTLDLRKDSAVSHRIIGSLSSKGAHDFLPSITKSLKRRILIKALPGTGKSTMMKALGEEAEKRGIDVLYGWCGLDTGSIDLVQFPELSVCLFDATEPHVYEAEREGDEILDLVAMCAPSEKAEQEIDEIRPRYKETIANAAGYMQSYARLTSLIDAGMDSALDQKAFHGKAEMLTELLAP
ncbi:hypothetical protein [Sporosarcina sp. SAFN-010]|uniref:hypothetical protein n=1 Tax=Sporosarcina sp. SAFN-010 TaxID=3387273 RepID=UPI003F81C592